MTDNNQSSIFLQSLKEPKKKYSWDDVYLNINKLSEDEVIFSLALYCRLKKIPTSQATRHLKKYLKSSFKRALKQINNQTKNLEKLTQLDNA